MTAPDANWRAHAGPLAIGIIGNRQTVANIANEPFNY
jgi:hypothetical protein